MLGVSSTSDDMVFGNGSTRVEFAVLETEAPVPGYSAGGDVRVSAQVVINRFAGACEAWIERGAWATFWARLEALEGSRHGEAVLDSMSPEELHLRLHSVDRLGHMAVEGEFLQYFYGQEMRALQALRLRFGAVEFDPSLLPHFVAEVAAARPAS